MGIAPPPLLTAALSVSCSNRSGNREFTFHTFSKTEACRYNEPRWNGQRTNRIDIKRVSTLNEGIEENVSGNTDRQEVHEKYED